MTLVADHLVPVQCEQLEPGMYVAELDRSWLHTPFESRGFLISQQEQIDVLRRSCEYVYVDPSRSDVTALLDIEAALAGPVPKPADFPGEELLRLNGCRDLLRNASSQIATTVRAAHQADRLEISPIAAGLDSLVDHILRYPDAMQWLIATEPPHGYLNRRSIGTAIYAVIFGRYLGMDRGALRELALGALLLDIGKTGVPIAILSKPRRLNSVERSFVRRHVDRSRALVQFSNAVEERVIDMVGAHHERLDGTGYPGHIAGTEIPLYARIAGIVDTFDALTQERGYARARSGHAALRHLNTWRNIKFDAALVDEFIRAIGVYPIGTLVELMDGSSGLVCSRNPGEAKRPNILLARDTAGRAVKTPQVIELGPTARILRALPVQHPSH